MSFLNQNNFIDSFSEHVNNVGFHKSNRFIVYIKGPSVNFIKNKQTNIINSLTDTLLTRLNLKEQPESVGKFLSHEDTKRLAVSVNGVTLPGKSISTIEFGPVGSGTINRYPYQETFVNELSVEFNCGLDHFERSYFQAWMNTVIDPVTHDVSLADTYSRDYKLLIIMVPPDITDFSKISKMLAENPMNKHATDQEFYRSLFFVRAHNIYPFEIQETQLSYDNINQNQKVVVKFNYNYLDDPVTIKMTNKTIEPSDIDFGQESPIDTFKRILREGVKYATDPKALRQKIIEEGLGAAGEVLGIENVEKMAEGGQVVDVYRQTKNTKDLGITRNI